MEFCEKIKKIRTDNNLTQEQFAEKLFVSRVWDSRLSSGISYCVLSYFVPFYLS